MKKNGLFILVFIFISVLSLGYLFLNPAFNYLSGYLSKSEQVKANILVVEGWLPIDVIEIAYDEFLKNEYEYIVTTGLKISTEYYELSSKGFLIFHSKNRFSQIVDKGPHSIEIDAFSKPSMDNHAYFKLFMNDSLVADFYPEERTKKYRISWNGSLNKIDSIMVFLRNDKGGIGDQNLYVKEITIDNRITIPYLNNSEFDITKPQRKLRIINNYISNAGLARNILMSMGIDSTQIIATSGERVKINRTLTSALAFGEWIKTTNINIKGINVISMGTHARRTWMTYNKVLNEKYKIGIISIPDSLDNHLREYKVLKTIRETLGIIYYWFILLPY